MQKDIVTRLQEEGELKSSAFMLNILFFKLLVLVYTDLCLIYYKTNAKLDLCVLHCI